MTKSRKLLLVLIVLAISACGSTTTTNESSTTTESPTTTNVDRKGCLASVWHPFLVISPVDLHSTCETSFRSRLRILHRSRNCDALDFRQGSLIPMTNQLIRPFVNLRYPDTRTGTLRRTSCSKYMWDDHRSRRQYEPHEQRYSDFRFS